MRNPAGSNPAGGNPGLTLAHSGTSAKVLLPVAQPSIKQATALISNSGTSSCVSGGSTMSGSSAGLPKLKRSKLGGAAAAARHHLGRLSAAAAAAGGALPSHPSKPARPVVPDVPLSTLQRWNLEQLEAHVKKLQEANQKIPQSVALLAADMRRKEEKRLAKRLANRRSACTSRARKKALIEEMTKDNARLRREAMILSFLPDPVLAISTDGVITFCSTQIERVLKHKVDHLTGANIEEIIVPSSRESIRRMIHDLSTAQQKALSSADDTGNESQNEHAEENQISDGVEGPARRVSVSAYTSEQTFPLLEVKVDAGKTSDVVGAGEDVSDSSGDPASAKGGQPGAAKATPGQTDPPSKKSKKAAIKGTKDSKSFEKKASASLNKNVEMCKLNKDKKGAKRDGLLLKDDVMGATVTANNADAKLSSLIHHPSSPSEKAASGKTDKGLKMQKSQSSLSKDSSGGMKNKPSGISSEDSGYRESGESPESNECPFDSLSSSSSSTVQNKRKQGRRMRPLAPTCNVRLIRDDLSTIWCELTSSIRTRPLDGPEQDPTGGDQKVNANDNDTVAAEPEEKELLLCFRPVCEGENVGEELRFAPKRIQKENHDGTDDGPDADFSSELKVKPDGTSSGVDRDGKKISTSEASLSADAPSSFDIAAKAQPSSPTAQRQTKHRPLKKRKFETEDSGKQAVKRRSNPIDKDTQADEKRAIESMMELAKSPP
jgi:PAS domain-containing protein